LKFSPHPGPLPKERENTDLMSSPQVEGEHRFNSLSLRERARVRVVLRLKL
jgi:hypothetical protein